MTFLKKTHWTGVVRTRNQIKSYEIEIYALWTIQSLQKVRKWSVGASEEKYAASSSEENVNLTFCTFFENKSYEQTCS